MLTGIRTIRKISEDFARTIANCNTIQSRVNRYH